jgi:hypothetical protein
LTFCSQCRDFYLHLALQMSITISYHRLQDQQVIAPNAAPLQTW